MTSSPPQDSRPLDHLFAVGRRLRLQGLSLALGIPSGILAARFLGPTHRGELAVFVAGSFLLSSLIGGCSHESLPFLIRERRDPAKAVGTAVVLQVALGLVAAMLSFLAPALG